MNARTVENFTFDEVAVGDHAQLVRTLLPEDIELFAAVSGDVNPAHLDPVFAAGNRFHKVVGHGMWAGSLISAVLGTKLPGAGTIYLGQDLRFKRPVGIGDTVTVTVTAREKDPARKVIYFDCRCTNQQGEDVVTGTAEVLAPTEKIRRPVIEVPEVSVAHRQRYRERLDGENTQSTPEGGGDTSLANSGGAAAPGMAPFVDGPVAAPFSLRGRRGLVLGIANEHSMRSVENGVCQPVKQHSCVGDRTAV